MYARVGVFWELLGLSVCANPNRHHIMIVVTNSVLSFEVQTLLLLASKPGTALSRIGH